MYDLNHLEDSNDCIYETPNDSMDDPSHSNYEKPTHSIFESNKGQPKSLPVSAAHVMAN